MSDQIKPNFMRYQRVAQVIATEPALKARMGGKTEVVLKPNGDKVEFPKEVIDVTERIHAGGHDAGTYSKDQIVQLAISIILYGDTGAVTAPKPAEAGNEAPASKQKTKRRPRAAKKPPVQKPKKVRKKRQPKPEVVPAAQPEKPKPEAPVEKKEALERPAKRAKAAPVEAVAVTIVSPPVQAQNSVVPFAVGCAVNSNLIAASQLLEIHDRTLEGKEIRERLDKIIDEINRRTVIPSMGRG